MRLSKITALLIVLILAVGTGTAIAAENSSENFKEIRTVEDFDRIRNDLSGNYKLMNDLDFNDAKRAEWEQIGNDRIGFTGVFDGNGKTIYNYSSSADENSRESGGFFKMIGENGSVKNLSLKNALASGNENIGVLTDINKGKIENCHSLNSESIANTVAGGLVGLNNRGEIINCSSSGTVFSETAGGLVGFNAGGKIKNCKSSAEVNGIYAAGGIAGDNSNVDSEILNCYSEGTIKSTERAGGIAGGNYNAKIRYCYSTSRLTEESKEAGGIVGVNEGNVSDCISINAVINGMRQTYFEKNPEKDTVPRLKAGEKSYIGRISSGANVWEEKPIDCFAWNQIETNKFRFNGDNGKDASGMKIWKMFPNGVWSGWDQEVWKSGPNGLPILKWEKSENPNAV